MLLDFLTSTKRPAQNTKILAQEEARRAIIGVNHPTALLQTLDRQAENVDLIAEQKNVDATCYEFFAKAEIEKAFRIYMKFDAQNHEVRTSDREYSVSWKAEIPSLICEVSIYAGCYNKLLANQKLPPLYPVGDTLKCLITP